MNNNQEEQRATLEACKAESDKRLMDMEAAFMDAPVKNYVKFHQDLILMKEEVRAKYGVSSVLGESIEKSKSILANPVAYEFHNEGTGHAYVDYSARQGLGIQDGYTAKPLKYMYDSGV